MVPSTVTGIAAFLLLLGPGFLYIRRVETLDALYRVSAFRETISIIFIGFACNAVSLLLFGLVRITLPAFTPDVGELVRNGQAYWNSEYDRVVGYAVGFYAIAMLIAFSASHPKVRGAGIWSEPKVKRLIGAPVLDARSAWSRLFDVDGNTIVRAGCELDDGSWVDGWVYDWNAQPEEDSERTLIIQAPICLRASGESRPKHLEGLNFVSVSHGRIVRLDVTHVDKSSRAAFNAVYEAY